MTELVVRARRAKPAGGVAWSVLDLHCLWGTTTPTADEVLEALRLYLGRRDLVRTTVWDLPVKGRLVRHAACVDVRAPDWYDLRWGGGQVAGVFRVGLDEPDRLRLTGRGSRNTADPPTLAAARRFAELACATWRAELFDAGA